MMEKAEFLAGSRAPSDCKDFMSAEERLERAIEAAKQRLCSAPTRDEKLEHWREMCRLIDQRTPQYVRFLERVRGLR